MRYARRTDATQQAIIGTLRACGLAVRDLSRAGGGCPDLAVSWDGQTVFVEAKTPGTQYGRRFNAAQAKWLDGWQGHVVLVRTVDEALALARELKARARGAAEEA